MAIGRMLARLALVPQLAATGLVGPTTAAAVAASAPVTAAETAAGELYVSQTW